MLPRLKGFSKLSLGDLKKIKTYCELYHSEDEERLAAVQRSAAAEDGYERRRRVHSELVTKLDNDIKILESELTRLFAEAITKFEQGQSRKNIHFVRFTFWRGWKQGDS
jgi:hypothetical protein